MDAARAPLHLELPATLEAVASTTAQLHALLPRRLSTEERHAVEIGVAEALTNIVQHGYAGQPGTISLDWCDGDSALEIRLCDRGATIPAETLAQAGRAFEFDPDDLERLPEGGFGLGLIRAAFDEVGYECRDGVNCLTLTKRFP